MSAPDASGRSAFFYGTLMAPQVLHRVCHGSTAAATHNLHARPAILHGFRRHRVRHADYPAIVPCAGAAVRGTHVSGLTDADIWRLDIFEGDEYSREEVRARILPAATTSSSSCCSSSPSSPPPPRSADEGDAEGGEELRAETYVWTAGREQLEDGEWDFAQFQREKMRFWVGAEGAGEYAGRPSIIEVDEAVASSEKQQRDGTGGRGVNGHITTALEEEHRGSEATVNPG